MKPTDVRIGNLVKYDGRIFEIYGTDKEYPILNTEEFGVGVVEWDDIEGVPLTEEILLKVWFEKETTNDTNWYSIQIATEHDADDIQHLSVNTFSKRCCLNHDYGCFFAGHEIKYLHQLQNLYFALTGEELNTEEIK